MKDLLPNRGTPLGHPDLGGRRYPSRCICHTRQPRRKQRNFSVDNTIEEPAAYELVRAFYAKVSIDDRTGCWLWTGAHTKGGYPTFWVRRLGVSSRRKALYKKGRGTQLSVRKLIALIKEGIPPLEVMRAALDKSKPKTRANSRFSPTCGTPQCICPDHITPQVRYAMPAAELEASLAKFLVLLHLRVRPPEASRLIYPDRSQIKQRRALLKHYKDSLAGGTPPC